MIASVTRNFRLPFPVKNHWPCSLRLAVATHGWWHHVTYRTTKRNEKRQTLSAGGKKGAETKGKGKGKEAATRTEPRGKKKLHGIDAETCALKRQRKLAKWRYCRKDFDVCMAARSTIHSSRGWGRRFSVPRTFFKREASNGWCRLGTYCAALIIVTFLPVCCWLLPTLLSHFITILLHAWILPWLNVCSQLRHWIINVWCMHSTTDQGGSDNVGEIHTLLQ